MTPDSPGYYGVVRNSLYSASVKSINSLGTPVYDPDEKIYPEIPEKTDNPFQVTVDNINWRLVSENLQLSW